ncbi:sigma-70 family RNA polymerase sigma factor [Paludisphaera sp.]|uniref:RNA polymerase sigma factor n=1 Tax=Paludisphaera sp. TaxID=2017432 RepID=UPI00301D69AA
MAEAQARMEGADEGESRDVADLVARARAGDQEAIRAFVLRYEDELRQMARGRLPRRLRGQLESMDIVQAVWQSFFTEAGAGPKDFENSRHLRGFLAGMVRNKVYEQDRRLTRTEKYAIAREEPLYVRRGDREVAREVPAHDPTPSQNVQARDRLALLTAGRPEREAEILRLRRDGMTVDDIAARLGVNEKTVRRAIEAARVRMEARGWS